MMKQEQEKPTLHDLSVSFFKWNTLFEFEKSDEGIFARWLLSNPDLSTVKTFASLKRKMEEKNCSEYIKQLGEKRWAAYEEFEFAKRPKNFAKGNRKPSLESLCCDKQ